MSSGVTAHGRKALTASAAGTRIALLTIEPFATAQTTGNSRAARTPLTCSALGARSSPSTPAVCFAATVVMAATSSRMVAMSSSRTRRLEAMEGPGGWMGRLEGRGRRPLASAARLCRVLVAVEAAGVVAVQAIEGSRIGIAPVQQAIAVGVERVESAAGLQQCRVGDAGAQGDVGRHRVDAGGVGPARVGDGRVLGHGDGRRDEREAGEERQYGGAVEVAGVHRPAPVAGSTPCSAPGDETPVKRDARAGRRSGGGPRARLDRDLLAVVVELA